MLDRSSQKGWLGLIDAFFPEPNPCEPSKTDLIDFEQIQKMIDDLYPNIPEDERLKSDSVCALELPYNRILQRPAKAGMVGLITAAHQNICLRTFYQRISNIYEVCAALSGGT